MNTTNNEEDLLVTFVFQFQNPETVRGLLAKGVSPNVIRESRTSVLMMAAMLPNSDICDALINAGAVVNCRNEQGITPLHCSNTAKAAELLINAGAELEASDDQGMTPLHYAVLKRNVHVIEVLLRHGANYLIPNDKGTSPMPWTFRLLSDAVIGLWLPLWFYVRMPEGEGMDRIESVARCAVYFVAVAAAGFMASANLPASHTAVMVGLASLQALARGRKSVADILGVITIALVAMSAIFA